MKKYTIFHPLYLSFFSPSLYREVGKNWKGLGFGYLLLLLAIVWIPIMIMVHGNVADFIAQETPKIINQIPKITISNGQVAVDAPVPYYIIDPQSGERILAIDTSGQTTSVEQAKALMLLTKNQFIFSRPGRGETRTYDLSEVQSFFIDRDRVNRWVLAFKNWFAILAYPSALACSWAYRAIQALVYAVIGMVFANILKTTLEYSALIRLSVIAVTPVIILNTLRLLAGVSMPYTGLLSFLLAMAYLFFGITANSEKRGAATS